MLIKGKCNDGFCFAQYVDFSLFPQSKKNEDYDIYNTKAVIPNFRVQGSLPSTPWVYWFEQYKRTEVNSLTFIGKSGKKYVFSKNGSMFRFAPHNIRINQDINYINFGSSEYAIYPLLFSYDEENNIIYFGWNYSLDIPMPYLMERWGYTMADLPSITPCIGNNLGFINNSRYINYIGNYDKEIELIGYKSKEYPNLAEFVFDVFSLDDINFDDKNDDENSEDGGKGTFDKTTEIIDFPTHTVPKITDSGFLSLYSPTLEQIRGLATYLMSNDFDLQTFSKAFLNPLQAILGLAIVPLNVPTGESTEIKVGNFGTGVYANKIVEQFYTINCGSIEIKKYYDTFIDLNSKIEVFLPYIGVRQLDAVDVVGKTIQLQYRVDVLTGSIVAFIKAGGTLLYTFSGQASMQIPVHQTDMTSIINTVLSTATTIGASFAEGGVVGAVSGAVSSASNILNTRVSIQKSGTVSGVSGFLNNQKPYLMLTIPRVATPKNLNTYKGYISYITKKLSNVKGYTEVHKINLKLKASVEEKNEIENLLMEGVLL